MSIRIYTIGHSTRPVDSFIGLLVAHGVSRVFDVRTVPRSRHNPQYGIDRLPESLASSGISYTHFPALGGFRRPQEHTVNSGWRNDAFRGFADYMQTEEFARALESLIDRAGTETTAIMCAEAVPWRCHRSLVSDALLVRGITVLEIVNEKKASLHALTPWAVVDGTRVTYPAPEG